MEFAEVLKRKQQPVRHHEVLLEPALLEERDRLVQQIARATLRHEAIGDSDWSSDSEAALRQQLLELEEKITAASLTLTFEALPRSEWYALVDEWLGDDPDSQIDDLPVDFMIDVVWRSLVDPKPASRDEVVALFETWSSTEVDRIYLAAFAVNREVRSIPFTGAGIGAIPSSGWSSSTAESEESPTANS